MAEVWEKQENESQKRYNMFCVYRDMGLARSYGKVVEALGKQPVYRRFVEVVASQENWVARTRAYDLYIDEQTRIKNEQEIIEMKKRHIQQSLLMQKNVIARIQDFNPKELSPTECVKMFEVAAKIERLSRGCEDNKVEVNNKVVVDTKEALEQRKLDNLTPEELEELEELTKKMNGETAEK